MGLRTEIWTRYYLEIARNCGARPLGFHGNRENRLKMFKVMKDAGVVNFGLGVEHGDQDFLNNVINKRLDLDEVISSIEMAHQVGITVHVAFILGFPHETSENRENSMNFARKSTMDLKRSLFMMIFGE